MPLAGASAESSTMVSGVRVWEWQQLRTHGRFIVRQQTTHTHIPHTHSFRDSSHSTRTASSIGFVLCSMLSMRCKSFHLAFPSKINEEIGRNHMCYVCQWESRSGKLQHQWFLNHFLFWTTDPMQGFGVTAAAELRSISSNRSKILVGDFASLTSLLIYTNILHLVSQLCVVFLFLGCSHPIAIHSGDGQNGTHSFFVRVFSIQETINIVMFVRNAVHMHVARANSCSVDRHAAPAYTEHTITTM